MIVGHIHARDLNPAQRAVLRSRERNVLMAGGFGSGKTTGGAIKAIQLKQDNGRAPGLVLAPNWRTMWSVTYPAITKLLRRFLSPREMPRLIDPNEECYLDFGDGVPVFLRSASNIDGFDGLDVGWAWGDEARHWKKKAWDVLKGRVRVKCPRPQIVLTTTPEMGWLSDEFNTGKPGRQLITASTQENALNLADGFIEDIKQSYSPRIWRALIDGIFTILEGAVYEAFDPNPATSKWLTDFVPTATWLADHKVYLAVDPGFRRSAWTWIAEVEPLKWIAFDQLIADNQDDVTCVRQVSERKHPIDEVWCDPASGNTQSFEGANTVKALLAIKGLRRPSPVRVISAANREIPFGVDKTRVMLGDPDNQRSIYLRIAKRLVDAERNRERGTIKSLAAYRYPETKDGKAITDMPLKDGINDHFADAVRYWTVGRWLCEPKLRQLDPMLSKSTTAGWRVAA